MAKTAHVFTGEEEVRASVGKTEDCALLCCIKRRVAKKGRLVADDDYMCLAVGKSHASWRKQMKSISVKLLATVVLASGLSLGTGLAQTQSDKEPSKAISIRGCLVKGDQPQEVWLAEKSGSIYGLESSKIDLNEHLGHKVIVRGYLLSQGKGAHEEAQKQDNTVKPERADFRVLTLKMISTTCL